MSKSDATENAYRFTSETLFALMEIMQSGVNAVENNLAMYIFLPPVTRKTYYNKSINKNGAIRQARKSMWPAVPPIKISGTRDKPKNKQR